MVHGRFLSHRGTPSHHPISWDSPWNKPCSYWATPMAISFVETSIFLGSTMGRTIDCKVHRGDMSYWWWTKKNCNFKEGLYIPFLVIFLNSFLVGSLHGIQGPQNREIKISHYFALVIYICHSFFSWNPVLISIMHLWFVVSQLGGWCTILGKSSKSIHVQTSDKHPQECNWWSLDTIMLLLSINMQAGSSSGVRQMWNISNDDLHWGLEWNIFFCVKNLSHCTLQNM